MLGRCYPDSCEYIRIISHQFLSTVDLKFIKLEDLFQHLSSLVYEECVKHQENLLNETLLNELIKKYPVRKSFQLAFLKNCIAQAEGLDIEFTGAYEIYLKLLNDKCGDEEVSFKHYFLGDKILTLRENNYIISSGTTGLCTWQAGIALANWCLFHNHALHSKRVIEVGCGSGLTGIALLHSSSPPKEYIFTDYHPLVLQQLRRNLEINFPGAVWPQQILNTSVNVLEFDWGDNSEFYKKNFLNTDVILGADVVYDIDLIEALCNVLDKLLNSHDKCAVIACTVRNQETIDIFVKTIENKSLVVTKDNSSYPATIGENFSSSVNIYVIKRSIEGVLNH